MQSRRQDLHWSSGKSKASWESCSLTRPGGDPFQAKRGDPVCRGDILETTAGGKIGIRFIDGTAFNLSDSARAVVKEFGGDGNEPSALFDISRGTFAFIAGEMAKHGRLRIETPFASIRGRAQSGGIGMLSLASLFFAALENAQASGPTFVSTLATPLLGTEDGIINIRESSDIINAQFGIIELTVGGQTIFIDNPFFEWIVRGTSVSQVPLSLAQLAQHQVESNNVSNIAGMGQGPTVGGPSGSGDSPPPTASVRDADQQRCADGYGRSADRRSDRRRRWLGRNRFEYFHSAPIWGRVAAASAATAATHRWIGDRAARADGKSVQRHYDRIARIYRC